MDEQFDDRLQCHVRKLTYNFQTRTGKLYIGDTSCADMKGCIDLFKQIDPKVETIRTIPANTSYSLLEGGKWFSFVERDNSRM